MQGYSTVLIAGLLALSRAQTTQDIANKFTAQLPVDIQCKTDPTSKLSCGVNFQDQCAEKWNFKNPCTPENLARNRTMFPHPQENNKFLMCGDFGKLYVVLCPRYEVFHEGCRQCVAQGSKLTQACEVHDIPLSETVSSNPCTPEAILSGKLFFSFPGDLGKYIHCDAWGKAWEMICTPGEVWDQYTVACVNPALMNPCLQSLRDPGHLFKHPCDPTMYIRCDSELIPYEVPCTGGDIFSEANQVCQSVTFYAVPPKNICGKYTFRFRSYSQSAFQVEPNQRLATIMQQQTGGAGSNTKVSGDFNSILRVWQETVKPSEPSSGTKGQATVALGVGGAASASGLDVMGQGMTVSKAGMDTSMAGSVGNAVDPFGASQSGTFNSGLQATSFSGTSGSGSTSIDGSFTSGAATDTTNFFTNQDMAGAGDLASGNINAGFSATAGTGAQKTASLTRVGDFRTASGDIATGIIDSAQTSAEKVVGAPFDASLAGTVSGFDSNAAFTSGNLIIDKRTGSTQGIDATGRVGAGMADVVATNQAGILSGGTGTAHSASTGTSGESASRSASDTIVGGFQNIFTDASGGSSGNLGTAGGSSSVSMGLSADVGTGSSGGAGVDSSMSTQTGGAGAFSGIDNLAKAVAGIIDTSSLIPGLDFASTFSSSAETTAHGPIVSGAAFSTSDNVNLVSGKEPAGATGSGLMDSSMIGSASTGDIGVGGRMNTGGSTGMAKQEVVSVSGNIQGGNSGSATSFGSFDSVGGGTMGTQDTTGLFADSFGANAGSSSNSGSISTDMSGSIEPGIHDTFSVAGDFIGVDTSGTGGSSGIDMTGSTGSRVQDSTFFAGEFGVRGSGSSASGSMTGTDLAGSMGAGIHDTSGIAGDFAGASIDTGGTVAGDMAGGMSMGTHDTFSSGGNIMGTSGATSDNVGPAGADMAGSMSMGVLDTSGSAGNVMGASGATSARDSAGADMMAGSMSMSMHGTSGSAGNFMGASGDVSASAGSAGADMSVGTSVGMDGTSGSVGNIFGTNIDTSVVDISGSTSMGMDGPSGSTGDIMGTSIDASANMGSVGADMTGSVGMHGASGFTGDIVGGSAGTIHAGTGIGSSAQQQNIASNVMGPDGSTGMGMGTQDTARFTGAGNFVEMGTGTGIQTNLLDTRAQMFDSSSGQSASGNFGTGTDSSSQGVIFGTGSTGAGSAAASGGFDATFTDMSFAGDMGGSFTNIGGGESGMSGSSGFTDFGTGAQVDVTGMGQSGSSAGAAASGGSASVKAGSAANMANHGTGGTTFLNADGTLVINSAGDSAPLSGTSASMSSGTSGSVGGTGVSFNAAMQMGKQAGGMLVESENIHPSLLREYVYLDTPFTEPCTRENLRASRTHFRLLNNPHSFIQCDTDGNMYVMKCNGNLIFDVATRSCYSGGQPQK